jgi:hypothetical protein
MKRNISLFMFFIVLLIYSLTLASHPLLLEAKIEQQNGVTIISNPKTPQPPDGIPLRLVFFEELSIGAEEGDENYMFGTRVYFNTDDDGNFYVNDWDRKVIKKFGPDGKFLLNIGGPGQGPGEFQNVWIPRFDKDQNMYVSDIVGRRRISFFDKEGTFLKQVRVPVQLSDISINCRGFYVGYQTTYIEDPKGDSAVTVLGVFDDRFQLVSEIHKSVRESPSPSGRDPESRAQFIADLLSEDAFKPQKSYILASSDLIYFGYPEKYEIEIFSSGGQLIRLIQREFEPLKVNEKHKEDFIREQEDEVLRFLREQDQALKKEIIKLVKYPKYLPAYNKFALMENGWLAVVVDHKEGEFTLFDLFDRQGKYIAQFEAKIPVANLLFKNGKAYALAIENDYRYVKRYGYEIQEFKNKKWINKE